MATVADHSIRTPCAKVSGNITNTAQVQAVAEGYRYRHQTLSRGDISDAAGRAAKQSHLNAAAFQFLHLLENLQLLAAEVG